MVRSNLFFFALLAILWGKYKPGKEDGFAVFFVSWIKKFFTKLMAHGLAYHEKTT